MSNGSEPIVERTAEPRGRFGDIRDDYDDDFGKVRTPADIARRKLLLPAIVTMVLATLAMVAALMGSAAVIANTIEEAEDELDVIGGVFLVLIILFGGCLFGLVFAGGLGMLRLERRGHALAAAYVVTGLSLAGPYGILFYPFGIWALVLLYHPTIKQEFDRPRSIPRKRFKLGEHSIALVVIGALVLSISLLIAAGIAWDAYTTNDWRESEVAFCMALCFAGFCLGAVSLFLGLHARRASKTSAKMTQPDLSSATEPRPESVE